MDKEKDGRKRILIVEDDEPLARLVKARLESAGYDVSMEVKGLTGLALAARERFDLVILDVNLPDSDGFQIARDLRRAYHPWALPILMLTVKSQPVDRLRGFAHGADAYLTKPFDSLELFETVSFLLGEAMWESGSSAGGQPK